MNFETEPQNVRTVTIRIKQRGKYNHAELSFPIDLCEMNNLKDKDSIVICYLCKSTPVKEIPVEEKQSL